MSAIENTFDFEPILPHFSYDEAVASLGDLTTRQVLSRDFYLEDDVISGLVYAQAEHPTEQSLLVVYPMSQFEVIGERPRVSQPVVDLWLNTVLPEVATGRTTVNNMAQFISRRDLGLDGRSIIECVREERRYRGGADLARVVLQSELVKYS
ncbi:MAG: hypothetical protein NTX11_04790 [Candidatus Saccharibacteria bacterium]|nr:hypothetical protein [Candidatus Saccharibacteria bacterium]